MERAEVWNLKDTIDEPNEETDDVLLGALGWYWDTTVEGTLGIETPPLGSIYLFGYAPGDSSDGQINVERTGTSYWNF